MIPQAFISFLAVMVVVFIAFYGFKSNSYMIHIALVATPLILFFVNNPPLWMVVIIGLIQSKLIFPGIPQGLQVVDVMMSGFILVMIARNIIVKPNLPRPPLSTFFLYGFLAVLLITIYFRGFGIRALGGDTWGGMGYVKIFLAAGFLLVSRYIQLSPRQIRTAIVLMILMGLLPFAAQVIFIASKGQIYQQYMFIEAYVAGLLGSLEAATGGVGVVRFHAIGSVAFSLLMAAIVLIPPQGPRKVLIGAVIIVCIALAGFSGHRGQIINMIAIVTLYAAFIEPGKSTQRLLTAGGLVFAGLLAVYPFVEHMPAPVQRALSFLPGAAIRPDVLADATFSTEWRIRIWDMAWAEVPKHLFVGKGIAFDPSELLTHTAMRDSVLNAFLAHNYHSGPLSLLLDTGLFGLLFASLFMITSAIEVYRSVGTLTHEPLLRRAYLYMAATYIFTVVSFFMIYGDLQSSFPALLIQLAALTAVRQSRQAQATRKAVPFAPTLGSARAKVAPGQPWQGTRPRRLTT